MNVRCKLTCFCIGMILSSMYLVAGFAQEKRVTSAKDATVSNSKKIAVAKTTAEQPPFKLDAKTEKTLYQFVKDHHEGLAPLLKSLEKNRPRQYQLAMRSLSRTYSRIQTLKEQEKLKQYDNALNQWKLKSRIQLKAAQVAVQDTPQRRKQLESLIAKQYDLRIKSLRNEQAVLKDRLNRVSDLVEKESDRDLQIQQNFESVMRTATLSLEPAKAGGNSDRLSSGSRQVDKSKAGEKNKSSNRGKSRKSDKSGDGGR